MLFLIITAIFSLALFIITVRSDDESVRYLAK